MSTIFTALTALRRIFPPGYKAVVFGFPYLDTLKMCRRPEWCDGCIFLGQGWEFDELREACINDKIMGVFTEFPSNPLLKCPDVAQLRSLADEFGFAVVVDDTLANFCNTDFLGGGHADILCTSLTKIFSGTGDAMGGSMVVNSKSPLHEKLVTDLNANYLPTLYHADAKVLLENGADVEQRNAKVTWINGHFNGYINGHVWLVEYDHAPYLHPCPVPRPPTHNSQLTTSPHLA